MKSILLSFSDEWYLPLYDGRKIFEHRKRFCNESVKAYLYIGKPVQKVVAIITLGQRIEISDWLYEYINYPKTISRIKDFLKRNRYAMPIIDFQEIEPIDLTSYKAEHKKFIVPRSYYYLDNNKSLKDYLESNTIHIGKLRVNNFDYSLEDVICTY